MDIVEKQREITRRPALARFLLTVYVGWIAGVRVRCMPRGVWRTRDAEARRKLEKLGLIKVRVERSPKGQYVKYAYLTEEGREVVKMFLGDYLDR